MPASTPDALTARDGLEIAFAEWGAKTGHPTVVLVHATGFCKEVCEPVVDDLYALRSGFRALALDQRAHGDSGVPGVPFDWWDVAGDVVELVGARGPVVGVGHSAGAAALLMAEMIQPGLFSGQVLVEPIVLPPPYGRYPDNPMAAAALRRRDRFESRQSAFENWRTKPAFAGWEERALWAYVDGGLRRDADSYVLKCSKHAEAETFMAATEHGAWDRLDEVQARVLLIAGENSTTHQRPFLEQLVERLPNAEFEIVPDATHMVWMERPGVIANHVARFL